MVQHILVACDFGLDQDILPFHRLLAGYIGRNRFRQARTSLRCVFAVSAIPLPLGLVRMDISRRSMDKYELFL
jgi:hypothetical protein